MQEMQIPSLGREDSLVKGMATHSNSPVFLPGEFHGQRNLADYSPWCHKELDTTERLTHFTILKIKMETFLEQENTSKHTNSHQGDDIIACHGASQIVLYT